MTIIMRMMNKLKEYDYVYVIGHNAIDFDSYFSSYILTKILKKFKVNAIFTILNDYTFSNEDKEIIDDYTIEKPLVINRNEIDGKAFILVDHNDISQSLKKEDCNVIFAIDHHIDTKNVKECYSVEYTSTLLYIYDMFKTKYKFNKKEKKIIALSVMTDSEYLTTTRFKESDKELYNELQVNINPKAMQNKYFKVTDFSLNINYNIQSNYKCYNIENINVNRIMIKGYHKDNKYVGKYLEEIKKLYDSALLIWNEYDTLKTFVYYNSNLVKEYDYILTSSVLIIKDLIKENLIE